VLAILGAGSLAIRGAVAQITVGTNRQVSAPNSQRAHYELWADIDRTNPARMLACSMIAIDSETTSSVVYASGNGGHTWAQTKVSSTDVKGGADDPICVFGHDGTAYYVVLGPQKGWPRYMWLSRSTDGGRTWSESTRLPYTDREYLISDGTNGKYRGHVYINGMGFIQTLAGSGATTTLHLLTSEDSGRTFIRQVQRIAVAPEFIEGMGNSVVLSDGTVAFLFGVLKRPEYELDRDHWNDPNKPVAWIKVITSADGGASLQPAVSIDDWYMERPRSEGAVIPQLAVDLSDSPFKDRLYAVWTDFRNGRLEIRFAYSADKGRTWSRSRVINDDRTALDPAVNGPDAMTPTIAVNEGGVVGAAWYDRRESSDNLGWYERFTASLDGGETWLPSVRVSEHPNAYTGRELLPVQAIVGAAIGQPLDLRLRVWGFLYTGGHTAAMAVDSNGVFWPFWFDNRTGVSQVWTASVAVAGVATKNGSPELTALDDATDKITLHLTNTFYDRSSNELTVVAELKNTSKDTLRAPVKVRVLRIESQVGVPVLLGADNGQAGAGAVLDFSSVLHNGWLLPDSTSGLKRLLFRLTDLRPFRQGKEFKFGLIDLDARVLVKRLKAQTDQRAPP